jgi:hypothetical protein
LKGRVETNCAFINAAEAKNDPNEQSWTRMIVEQGSVLCTTPVKMEKTRPVLRNDQAANEHPVGLLNEHLPTWRVKSS